MLQVYPTTVALSNRINLDGTLQEDVRRRVDLSVELYDKHLTHTVTMSGKHDPKDWDAPLTHAEAMKRYAIQKGVYGNYILKEEDSLDTMGQAFFVKRNIIIPRDWDRLIVVSSDYHRRRVETIFDFVFGREFLIEYRTAPTSLRFNPKKWLEEKAKIAYFLRFFRGINPGDDDTIAYKLFTEHPLYKK